MLGKHEWGTQKECQGGSVMDSTNLNRSASQMAVLGVSVKTAEGPMLTESLRLKLENVTKTFNGVNSENTKIRLKINAFRKERTLFDKVFKELEQQIRVGETTLLSIMRKNDNLEGELTTAEGKIQGIEETLGKMDPQDFFRIIAEQKKIYDTKLQNATDYSRKSLMINLEKLTVVCEPDRFTAPVTSRQSQRELFKLNKKLKVIGAKEVHKPRFMDDPEWKPSLEREADHPVEKRIFLVDKIINDFKFRSEENDFVENSTIFEIDERKLEEGKAEVQRLSEEVWSTV